MTAGTPAQAGGLLDPLHALAAKWDANAARNQRNGQSLVDQGDEYGNEGLAVAEALGACVAELRAVLADAAQQAADNSINSPGPRSEGVPAPELAATTDPDCTVCAQTGGPHGAPQPAPELAAANVNDLPATPGRPTTSLEDAMLRNVDGLNDLIRDMLQSFPDTADEQEWRDRAGALHVCDPDGQPYKAYTEDDL